MSYFAIDLANALGHFQFLQKAFAFVWVLGLVGFLSVFSTWLQLVSIKETKTTKTWNPSNSSRYLNTGHNLKPDHVMEVKVCK